MAKWPKPWFTSQHSAHNVWVYFPITNDIPAHISHHHLTPFKSQFTEGSARSFYFLQAFMHWLLLSAELPARSHVQHPSSVLHRSVSNVAPDARNILLSFYRLCGSLLVSRAVRILFGPLHLGPDSARWWIRPCQSSAQVFFSVLMTEDGLTWVTRYVLRIIMATFVIFICSLSAIKTSANVNQEKSCRELVPD